MTFSPPHPLDGARWANMRVGLIGGSFNPPHDGHVHISLVAEQSLQLDFVWWLLTPQNPLKESSGLKPYEERLDLCRALTQPYPRLLVTDIERRLGLSRSFDTVVTLKRLFPDTKFVWVTGMDNALTFHKWHRWKDILKEMPTAHIARPPALTLIEHCPLRLLASQKHVVMNRAGKPPLHPGTTFWLLQRKMIDLSSTRIRNAGSS